MDRVLGVALILAALAAPPALAFQAEVHRYYQAVNHVCSTGVTPELIRLYQEATRAVESAQYGGGRGNNFWGVKTPEQAWLACFQSPGFQ